MNEDPAPAPSSGRATEPRAVRPAWAYTPEGLVRAPVLAWDRAGRLRPHAGEPVEDIGGIVLPGLINAHTHLELGPLAAPAGLGLPDWVRWLRAAVAPSAATAGRGVVAAIRAGTAAVIDIGNSGLAAGPLEAAGLAGLALHEVLGIDRAALPDPIRAPSGAVLRPTPHAPYSTSPALIQACAAEDGPWSIHFDEDPAERELLATGEGAWARVLRALGRDLSRFGIPGLRPAAYLDALGVLGPRTLLVHATLTRDEDLDRLAERGARVAVCVRSNLHITGRLPDLPGLLARGIPVALGTDSLASAPDLDLLAEAAAVRRAFPEVAPAALVHALTAAGADAAGLPLGRLREGEAPGLLWVDLPDGDNPLARLLDGTRWRRRWLVPPAGRREVA